MTPCTATVEQWARALCKAFGSDPGAVIGNPPNPRWKAERYLNAEYQGAAE